MIATTRYKTLFKRIIIECPLSLSQNNFVKLTNCKIFCIIDVLSQTYSLKSTKLLAINTHRSIDKIIRLTFGVTATLGTSQQAVNTRLMRIKNTCGYKDGIVIG